MTVRAYTPRVEAEERELRGLLAELPWALPPSAGGTFGHLESLMLWERAQEPAAGSVPLSDRLSDVARRICPDDPGQALEYILAQLDDVRASQVSVLTVRNRAAVVEHSDAPPRRELALGDAVLASAAPIAPRSALYDPVHVDRIVAYAESATALVFTSDGRRVAEQLVERALTVLERYGDYGLPATVSIADDATPVRRMQTAQSQRPTQRLSAVVADLVPKAVAISAARALAGWGNTTDRSLIVHAARKTHVLAIPESLIVAWRRDLATLEPATWTDARTRRNAQVAAGRAAVAYLNRRPAAAVASPPDRDRSGTEWVALVG